MPEREVDVLIVGGSLVGMFAAALLGQHGVRPLVAEKHRSTAIHPRAAMIYQRTMEVIRSLGVEEQVRRKSYEQFEPDGAIMSVESIAGRELHWDIPRLNEYVRDLSPSERLFISQPALEPVLKRHAEGHADLRFHTELVSFTQDDEGVSAQIRDRDTGEISRIRARYMIAADGAHSPVRRQLGIPMLGRGVLSRSLTVYFHAHVGPLMRGRNLSVILVRNPVFRGFFRIEKPFESGFLVLHTIGDPDHPVTDLWDLTDERCLELLRIGLGADIDARIESIQRWECEANVAEHMRSGRIFLAGDSAHVMPPYGGFGGNAGIHDVHNLAWKLAFVLGGFAGPGLLDTYEPERLPVARMTVEQAYLRYVVRGAQYLGTSDTQPFVNDAAVDLGFLYPARGETSATPLHDDPRALRARVGARAPHVPLADGRSTIDLFGRTFVLITGGAGESWANGFRTATAQLSLPLDVHSIDAVREAYDIAPDGAVLVRPDSTVAWRSRDGHDAAATSAEGTLRYILFRDETR